MTTIKYRIDVCIVDDHSMLNEGLTSVINQSSEAHVSNTFTTLAACRQALMERQPDVLLLDVSLPDGDGIDFCREVAADYPKVRILAVTVHDEYSLIHRMLEAGAHGYLLKNSSGEELLGAIVAVWKGQKYISPAVADILDSGNDRKFVLTDVEKNVLKQICDGLTNPEIAANIHLSTETINWYRKRLLSKFNVKNSVSLVRKAMEEKLV
ncbi:MAG: response regulator transcription factor [Bacteroidales bacterium]|nr:response regulator transcription factor [Bacteroidales bacterium]